MTKYKNALVTTVLIVLFHSAKLQAIDVTPSSGGGPSPLQLAQSLVDSASGITLVANSVNTTINNPGQGNPASDPRAYGSFTNGVTANGTSLPAGNGGPAETYVGGIQIDAGICLCTGVASDSVESAAPNLGFGLEGPNNGDGEGIGPGAISGTTENHTGEISRILFTAEFQDEDFVEEVFPNNNPGGGDPTVLNFEIEITNPGFLRLSFIFGSDEFPAYVDPLIYQFNDSFAALIADENIATLKSNSVSSAFNLFDISECTQLFVKNDTAPQPIELTQAYVDPVEGPLPNLHAQPAESNYNIEFGGFTKKLTRETCCVLAPGTYSVKIVVQDVVDQRVDAAVLLETSGLKLFEFLKADFNLDGEIDWDDFGILLTNYQNPGTFKFIEGDANGDGTVGIDDFSILASCFGQVGGNKNLCADFNRDNNVNGQDFVIWQQHVGLPNCASRFEGDADQDGDVDSADLAIYQQETGSGEPSGLCECGGSQQQAMAGGGGTGSAQANATSRGATASVGPNPYDTDGDGDSDRKDLKNWGVILGVE